MTCILTEKYHNRKNPWVSIIKSNTYLKIVLVFYTVTIRLILYHNLYKDQIGRSLAFEKY